MSDKNPHEVLWDLIKHTRFCMLAHRHGDGSLHSHPLTTVNDALGEDGCLYFFVSRSTEVGQRVAQDGNVNLSYANPDKDTWVSVSGTAQAPFGAPGVPRSPDGSNAVASHQVVRSTSSSASATPRCGCHVPSP